MRRNHSRFHESGATRLMGWVGIGWSFGKGWDRSAEAESLPSYGTPAIGPLLSAPCETASQFQLFERCSLTANFSPASRAALAHIPTTSLCGPVATAFQRGWCFEFHRSKLS